MLKRNVDTHTTARPLNTFEPGSVGPFADASPHLRQPFVEHPRSLLEQIIDARDEPILSKDLNGIITSWSASAVRLFGYSASEMIGENVLRLVPESLHAEEAEFLRRVASGERIVHYVTERLSKSGDILHLALTISPVRNQSGKIVGSAKMAQSVGQIEESLYLNERRLELAQRAAGMGTFELELPWGNRRWSPQMFELFGLPPESAQLGVDEVQRMIHKDDRRLVAKQLESLKNGQRIHIEFRIILPDSEMRWLQMSGKGVGGITGAPTVLIGVVFNITERKQAAELLRLNEERLRLAQDVAGMGTFDVELPSGKWTWSRHIFVILGLNADGPQPKIDDLLRICHPDDRLALREHTVLMTTGDKISLEYRIIREDGEVRWVESFGKRIFDNQGKPIRFLGVGYDITERKLTQSRLRHSEDQLRALVTKLQTTAERERRRIARELHDQLGQALTGIKLDMDWIVRKHGTLEEPWVPLMTDAMKVVDSTITLVRKLSTELRPEMLDAFGLQAAIEWHAKEFHRRTGIACIVEVPQEPTDLSSDQNIAAFRIFQEALTNIVRHAQAKKVVIALEHDQDDVVLTIEDDGTGFSEVTLERSPSLGILGMRERAQILGAGFSLKSELGIGTSISLRIRPEQPHASGSSAL
jgi:PAS domain S-box-containing protein